MMMLVEVCVITSAITAHMDLLYHAELCQCIQYLINSREGKRRHRGSDALVEELWCRVIFCFEHSAIDRYPLGSHVQASRTAALEQSLEVRFHRNLSVHEENYSPLIKKVKRPKYADVKLLLS